MPNISMTTNKHIKLLETLNPHNAADPDKMVAYSPGETIANRNRTYIVIVIFSKPLYNIASVPDDWCKANAILSKTFKKEIDINYRDADKCSSHASAVTAVHAIQGHLQTLQNQSTLQACQYGFITRHSTDTQQTIFIRQL